MLNVQLLIIMEIFFSLIKITIILFIILENQISDFKFYLYILHITNHEFLDFY
jgi:hypothetical protein